MASWSDAERAIRRDAVKADRTYRTTQDDLNALAKDVTAVDAVHPALPEFRRLLAERDRMIADTATDREAIMTFDHLEAKAKSRAIRTRHTCVQFLADIERGEADRNTRSEAHTSEHQSLMRNSYAAYCLTKKNKTHY